MPFFEELEGAPESVFPRKMVDGAFAERYFYKAVLKYQPGRTWKKTNWANQFRLLRKDIGDDAEAIDEVLTWFIDNWKVQGINPGDAHWFRSNFYWLQQKFMKGFKHTPRPPSEIAEEVIEATKSLPWPAGQPVDFIPFVQESEQNYTSFRIQFLNVYNNVGKYPAFAGVLHYLKKKLTTYVKFLTAWVLATFDRVKDWEAWSGTLKGFQFTVDESRPGGKTFRKWFIGWCCEYAGPNKGPSIAQKVMNAILKEIPF